MHHARRAVAVAAAASLALALTSCAADGPSAAEASPSASRTPAPIATWIDDDRTWAPKGEGSTEYPLTLPSPFGKTTLEQRPERIAVLGGGGEVEAVLGLQAAPVIAPEDLDVPWLADTRLNEIPGYFDPYGDGFSLARIVASQPDLIVAPSLDGLDKRYDALAAIAPVLVADEHGETPKDWAATAATIGWALDLPEAAAELTASATSSIDDVRAANPELAGKRIAVLVNDGPDDGLRLRNSAGSPSETLLTQLGAAPVPGAGADFAADGNGRFPVDRVGLIGDVDAIVVLNRGSDGAAPAAGAWLASSPQFQALGAVQRGAVVNVDADAETGALPLNWALSDPTVLSSGWAAEQLAALVKPVLSAPPA